MVKYISGDGQIYIGRWSNICREMVKYIFREMVKCITGDGQVFTRRWSNSIGEMVKPI